MSNPAPPPAPEGHDADFESLLVLLKEARGFDFTGYKRTSLVRRVRRRMNEVGVSRFADYRDLLEVDGAEFTALFNTILINVTSFFRDPDAWELLRTELLPNLLASRPTGPIRVWSAGCASGQEAYSLAICLAEALGADEFRARVKVYATDVDDEALAEARTATYTQREVESVPTGLLQTYFEPRGARWTFRTDLRRSVIFGRADLVQDAPISHVDLLACRNTLMYLTADTQARIADRLHYSLNADGLLFLGKAEMLLSQGALFAPLDLKNRFFARVGPQRATPRTIVSVPDRAPAVAVDEHARLRAEALTASPVAQVVLNAEGRMVLSNQRADAVLGLTTADTGRLFQDLEMSYRPVELRSAVDSAHAQGRTVWIRDVEFSRGRGEPAWYDIQVVPLRSAPDPALGTAVSFIEITRSRQLQDELEATHRQLETAYEELQSTNEELETTNEELQSTVEELETTNEELHSTNEELETMNEELQSMNDELQHSNTELRVRTEQVDSLNLYMEGVFSSLRVGVVVVDADMRIRVWNTWSSDLWGVRADEAVGEHLMTLDIGLPLHEIAPAVRSALAEETDTSLVLASVNRRGRHVVVNVTVSPLVDAAGAGTGAVVIVEQDHPDEEPADVVT